MHVSQSFHDYHEASAVQPWALKAELGLSRDQWPDEWKNQYVKEYPRAPVHALPLGPRPDGTLLDCLEYRESRRANTGLVLPLEELAVLLRTGLGVRSGQVGGSLSRRCYPSAGARFPTEAYVLALDCHELPRGCYHYDVATHSLHSIGYGVSQKTLERVFCHPWVVRSRCIIVLTAVIWRSEAKYGERAYRYACFEVGHVMQNLCLIAASLNVGLTPVGGFADAALWRLLDCGDPDELPLYAAVIP